MSNIADWARGAVRWETGLAIVVVLILIIGSAASPDFLTGNNLFNLGLSNGEIAIMTLPLPPKMATPPTTTAETTWSS